VSLPFRISRTRRFFYFFPFLFSFDGFFAFLGLKKFRLAQCLQGNKGEPPVDSVRKVAFENVPVSFLSSQEIRTEPPASPFREANNETPRIVTTSWDDGDPANASETSPEILPIPGKSEATFFSIIPKLLFSNYPLTLTPYLGPPRALYVPC